MVLLQGVEAIVKALLKLYDDFAVELCWLVESTGGLGLVLVGRVWVFVFVSAKFPGE